MRVAALLLTVVTGFTGLVYEVTWQKYMATLLGSHSEATAAVLGIFLAGLSLGYSVFGGVTKRLVDRARRTDRPARLFLAYGAVEAAIGVYALAFPMLFDAVRTLSLAIPHAAGGLGFAFDVGLVVLLLGPPTVLMGGTIPLLTQALSRDLSDATRFHALVYACNTIGAFAGALAASFVLIPALGLAGVMFAMSGFNLAAGAAFALFERRSSKNADDDDEPAAGAVSGLRTYASIGLLAGFSVMVLQNVFIRLGGLALGSSEYTFSIVVSVFVLCIAIGSFAVSLASRIGPRVLLVNQCVLIAYVTFLYLHLEKIPLWAYVLRGRFGVANDDFFPFQIAVFLGFVVLIGPAAILSGAILPLLFHHLRRETGDLGAVAGRLYSWNTVGSLLGALIGGYALLAVVDLHHVYRIAIAALALATALLAWRVLPRAQAMVTTGVLVAAMLGIATLAPWNPAYSSWGLFRFRGHENTTLAEIESAAEARIQAGGARVIFHDDDPIASVAVLEIPREGDDFSRAIVSNGKGDGDTYGDYKTMAMAALLPAMMVEPLERVFVVGFGTGTTVGEFASLESVREITVAEFSPAVIRAAPLFDFANREVSSSPKMQFIASDAYRSLMQSDGLFDVIASVPSNPWMTGIEMLFSREFLTAARGHLAPGGVYVQWYHQYETDEESVAVVLRTFASVFERVAVWYGLGPDLLVLGFNDDDFRPTPEMLALRAAEPDIAAGLVRSGVSSLPALLAHELLPVGALDKEISNGPIHTLYHPILNHVAGRAFFRGDAGRLPQIRSGAAAAAGARNSVLRQYLGALSGPALETARIEATREACRLRKTLCAALLVEWEHDAPDSPALPEIRRMLTTGAGAQFGGDMRPKVLTELARVTAPDPATDPVSPREAEIATQLYRWFYQYPAPFDPEHLISVWERCVAPAGAAEQCAEGLAEARRLAWPR